MQNCIIPQKGCKEHIPGECLYYSGAFVPQFNINNGDNLNVVVQKIAAAGVGGGPAPVTSVFGRTGAIVAAGTDYSAFYPQLLGSYSNPNWISSLAWNKITGTPTSLVDYGIIPVQADYDAFFLTPAEANASFSLLGHTHTTSQITNLSSYTGFDARYYTETEVNTLLSGKENLVIAGLTTQYWRGDKTWQTLNTTVVPEGSNLYFTNTRSRTAISLTTLGTVGAATYNSSTGVLNIPNYATEIVTASNIGGSGIGVFSSKVGSDLQFKKIAAGANVSVSESLGVITISSTGSGGGGGSLADGSYGDVTVSGVGTIITVNPDVITFGKIQNVPTNTILGRYSALTGDVETATIGTGLVYTANVLNVSLTPFSTDDLSQGSTNLYFTNAAARSAINLTNGLTYNSTTGVGKLGGALTEFTQIVYTGAEPLLFTTPDSSGTVFMSGDTGGGATFSASASFGGSAGYQMVLDHTAFSILDNVDAGTTLGVNRIKSVFRSNLQVSAIAGTGVRVSTIAADGTIGAIPNGTNTHVLTLVGGAPVWQAPTASGEVNTASSLGGGLVIFDSKSGVDLRFNTLNATDFDLATNLISIDATLKSNWNTAFSWGNHAGLYQPLDGDLTSIAGLVGTTGLLRKTAANTWSLDTATYLTANQSITLSGDVTGTGTTAITTSIASTVVTGKLLTGYVVGANTDIAATDTILQAFGKLQGQIDSFSSGFTNPMTTLGDIITGGASGTPTRLGVGSDGQILTVSGGVPTWQNAPTGTGEVNTASNLGGGLANFDSKSGVDLRFNTFAASDFDLAVNVISIDATLKSNWNTAFSWGNHAGLYQPLDGDLTSIAGLAGTSGLLRKTAANTWSLDTNTYLTSFTETDPIFTASAASGIVAGDITNWNAAYNDKINSASFNTSTGVLTLTQQDAGTVTVDLDGKYAEAVHTHTTSQITDYGVMSFATITGNQTAAPNTIYYGNTTTAGFTVTINPTTLLQSAGKTYKVVVNKISNDANSITITPSTGAINGAASYILFAYNESVTVVSDGTNLYII